MEKSVKIYSTSTCPYCAMAKNFLKEKNVAFEDLDVGRDREALVEMKQKSGQLGVPVLDVAGEIVVGFDKEAIENALSKASVSK